MRSQNSRMNVVIHNVNQTTSSVIINSNSPSGQHNNQLPAPASQNRVTYNMAPLTSSQQREIPPAIPYIEPSSSNFQGNQSVSVEPQYLTDGNQPIDYHTTGRITTGTPLTAAIHWMEEQHRLFRETTEAQTECMNALHDHHRHYLLIQRSLAEKEGELSRIHKMDTSRDGEVQSLKAKINVIERENKKLMEERQNQLVVFSQKHNQAADLRVQLNKLEDENDQLRDQNQAAIEKINSIVADHYQMTQEKRQFVEKNKELTAQLQKFSEKVQEQEEMLVGKEDKINTAEISLKKLLVEREQILKKSSELNDHLLKTEKENEEKEKILTEKDQEVAKLQQKYHNIESIYFKTNSRVQALAQENTELESKVGNLESSLDSLKSENSYNTQVNKTLQDQMRISNDKSMALEKEITEVRASLKEKDAVIEETEKTLNERAEEIAKLKEKEEATAKELDEVKSQLQTEQDSNSQAQDKLKVSTAKYNALDKELATAKKKVSMFEKEMKAVIEKLKEKDEEVIRKAKKYELRVRQLQEEMDKVKVEADAGKPLRGQLRILSAQNTVMVKEIEDLSQKAKEYEEALIVTTAKLKEKEEELNKRGKEFYVKMKEREEEYSRRGKDFHGKLKEKEEELMRKTRDYQSRLRDLQNEVEELKNKLAVVTVMRDEINLLTAKNINVEKELLEARRRVKLGEDKLQEALVRLRMKDDELSHMNRTNECRGHLEDEISRLKCELTDARDKVEESAEIILQQKKIADKQDEVIEEQNKSIRWHGEELLRYRKVIQRQAEDLDEKSEVIYRQNNAIADESIRAAQLINALKEEVKAMEDRLHEVESLGETDKVKELEKKLSMHERDLEKKAGLVEELQVQIGKDREALKRVEEEKQELKQEMNKYITDAEASKKEIQRLKNSVLDRKTAADKHKREACKLYAEKQKLEQDLKSQKDHISQILITRLQYFRKNKSKAPAAAVVEPNAEVEVEPVPIEPTATSSTAPSASPGVSIKRHKSTDSTDQQQPPERPPIITRRKSSSTEAKALPGTGSSEEVKREGETVPSTAAATPSTSAQAEEGACSNDTKVVLQKPQKRKLSVDCPPCVVLVKQEKFLKKVAGQLADNCDLIDLTLTSDDDEESHGEKKGQQPQEPQAPSATTTSKERTEKRILRSSFYRNSYFRNAPNFW